MRTTAQGGSFQKTSKPNSTAAAAKSAGLFVPEITEMRHRSPEGGQPQLCGSGADLQQPKKTALGRERSGGVHVFFIQ
ncbi:hypothetical protein QJ48_33905 [Paenibacillus sp. A3]|uniref:hypothetical protein n=1 Tax=Paenibacillus sp. A3 TaxID=1337054 RepID=UPI0006D5869D|nr:hypothetical protein [Paenibacillus sp. A3]KPV55303.1 hypothetical protein QJ48_33905 [Paenibacillus sp. A3]